jgi:hypothetical protein
MSLKIVAVNEHEEPEITCATHTLILDDTDRKRLIVADISPETFQVLRSCRAIDIDPLQRGKIVAHDYEASMLTAMLKDSNIYQAPVPPKRVTLKCPTMIRIIDLDENADIEQTGVSFIVLFEDTDQSRTMIATLSIHFHEPLDRFCRSFDVESLPSWRACGAGLRRRGRCKGDQKTASG